MKIVTIWLKYFTSLNFLELGKVFFLFALVLMLPITLSLSMADGTISFNLKQNYIFYLFIKSFFFIVFSFALIFISFGFLLTFEKAVMPLILIIKNKNYEKFIYKLNEKEFQMVINVEDNNYRHFTYMFFPIVYIQYLHKQFIQKQIQTPKLPKKEIKEVSFEEMKVLAEAQKLKEELKLTNKIKSQTLL